MDIKTNFQKWQHQPTSTSGFEIPYKFKKTNKRKSRGSK